jgi:hypothetical protein
VVVEKWWQRTAMRRRSPKRRMSGPKSTICTTMPAKQVARLTTGRGEPPVWRCSGALRATYGGGPRAAGVLSSQVDAASLPPGVKANAGCRMVTIDPDDEKQGGEVVLLEVERHLKVLKDGRLDPTLRDERRRDDVRGTVPQRSCCDEFNESASKINLPKAACEPLDRISGPDEGERFSIRSRLQHCLAEPVWYSNCFSNSPVRDPPGRIRGCLKAKGCFHTPV